MFVALLLFSSTCVWKVLIIKNSFLLFYFTQLYQNISCFVSNTNVGVSCIQIFNLLQCAFCLKDFVDLFIELGLLRFFHKHLNEVKLQLSYFFAALIA